MLKHISVNVSQQEGDLRALCVNKDD